MTRNNKFYRDIKTKLLLFFLFSITIITNAQWQQIGLDIDGETANDNSGCSVSLSADGSIVAIGALSNVENGQYSGHVRVYQNQGGIWTQFGQDIDGEVQGDRSGKSVSLSSDGTILAIGAPGNDNNGSGSGHVRVYQYFSGNWIQIGQDIDGEGPVDYFGSSVSLNSNGTIVAIGAPETTLTKNTAVLYYESDVEIGVLGNDERIFSNAGYVRIYQNNSGNWTQIGQDILGPHEGYESGKSVSLNSDGSIVAIGAAINDVEVGPDTGHVTIYRNISGNWTQIGQEIDGTNIFDNFGHSVSINSDGTIVAGAAPGRYVRVYQNQNGVWSQIGNDIHGEATGDHFGYSISLSSNGSIVTGGGPGNDGNGSALGHTRIFQNQNGQWSQIGNDIDGEAQGDWSGVSVCLSSNGSIVAIGAFRNDGNGPDSGHVRVFQNQLLGADKFLINPNVSIYPNPTSGMLNIQSEENIVQIDITNSLGQLVLTNTNKSSIDIATLAQGLYYLKILDENGNLYVEKVVKE